MPRRIVIIREDGSVPILSEEEAHNEPQLQERMKLNPDLLPLDEFGLTGPPMVVGRETTLASGAVDLLLVARGGEIVVVEFKTGPKNPDFRSALAQLLDYGSDLWGLDFESFEREVVRRYFMSHHADGSAYKGCKSLLEAAAIAWHDSPMSDEEVALFKDQLSSGLATGAFHYVVVAQRFTPAMETTIRYLNARIPPGFFYLVEMVRFTGGGLDAFESRTVLKPTPTRRPTPGQYLSEESFLERVTDQSYRDSIRSLFDAARSLGLSFYWGTTGMSLRFLGPNSKQPVTVAWLFPPEVVGWMGLRNVNLGYDPSSPETGKLSDILGDYITGVQAIPGGVRVVKGGLIAWMFGAKECSENMEAVVECLERLVKGAVDPGSD